MRHRVGGSMQAAPPGWQPMSSSRKMRMLACQCCMRTVALCALSAVIAHIFARLTGPQPQRALPGLWLSHSNFSFNTMANVLGNTWDNKVRMKVSNGFARSWGMPAPRGRRLQAAVAADSHRMLRWRQQQLYSLGLCSTGLVHDPILLIVGQLFDAGLRRRAPIPHHHPYAIARWRKAEGCPASAVAQQPPLPLPPPEP
jgi:hypothetical protein